MSFDLGLSGRRVLVTAGTKGVGASVIEVLRENGAKVVTTARSIPRSSIAGVHYIAANLTTAEGCTCVAHSALDHLGGIDIVVNVLGGSEAPAVAVPVGAVQSVSGLPMVFIEEAPGHYRVRPVESGQEAHGLIEIRRGLQPGDQVVTAGAFILKSELLKSTIGGDDH